MKASTHQTCHTITKPSQKIRFQRFVCFKETFLQGGDQLTHIFTGGLKQQHGVRKDCCSSFIVYFQLLFLIYLSSRNNVSRLIKRGNIQATKCLREISWYAMCKHTCTYLAHVKVRLLLTVEGPTFVRTSKSWAATEIDKTLFLDAFLEGLNECKRYWSRHSTALLQIP